MDKVSLVYSGKLEDDAEFSMYLSELDMQKIVRGRPDLVEPGLKVVDFEKRVEPGFIDVYATDEKGRMVVIEIKREKADRSAVQQLARYVQAVRKRTGAELRAVLVAPMITKDSVRLARSIGVEFKAIKPQTFLDVLKTLRSTKQDTLGQWF